MDIKGLLPLLPLEPSTRYWYRKSVGSSLQFTFISRFFKFQFLGFFLFFSIFSPKNKTGGRKTKQVVSLHAFCFWNVQFLDFLFLKSMLSIFKMMGWWLFGQVGLVCCIFQHVFVLVFNLYVFLTEMAIKQLHIFVNNRVSFIFIFIFCHEKLIQCWFNFHFQIIFTTWMFLRRYSKACGFKSWTNILSYWFLVLYNNNMKSTRHWYHFIF